jgi:transposase-like protein
MASYDDLSMAERWRRSQLGPSRADAGTMDDAIRTEDSAPPARCPACRSQQLKTTSKVVSVETYWRCCDCGEVWNAGRHRSGTRYTPNRPFGR